MGIMFILFDVSLIVLELISGSFQWRWGTKGELHGDEGRLGKCFKDFIFMLKLLITFCVKVDD